MLEILALRRVDRKTVSARVRSTGAEKGISSKMSLRRDRWTDDRVGRRESHRDSRRSMTRILLFEHFLTLRTQARRSRQPKNDPALMGGQCSGSRSGTRSRRIGMKWFEASGRSIRLADRRLTPGRRRHGHQARKCLTTSASTQLTSSASLPGTVTSSASPWHHRRGYRCGSSMSVALASPIVMPSVAVTRANAPTNGASHIAAAPMTTAMMPAVAIR
jgi:hypothetical protein